MPKGKGFTAVFGKELVLGGYKDWRLPTLDEWQTIYKKSAPFKYHFSDGPGYYWTSSNSFWGRGDEEYYYISDSSTELASNPYSVRCVRGGK